MAGIWHYWTGTVWTPIYGDAPGPPGGTGALSPSLVLTPSPTLTPNGG